MPDLMYLELKSGYNDNGPAWIGYVNASKSGRTLYWNDHAFQKYNGIGANYVDIETGDEYWISGVKKRGTTAIGPAAALFKWIAVPWRIIWPSPVKRSFPAAPLRWLTLPTIFRYSGCRHC